MVLSDELADVQRVLPALEALATPAMRDRHWHKVVALLGLDQARPPQFFLPCNLKDVTEPGFQCPASSRMHMLSCCLPAPALARWPLNLLCSAWLLCAGVSARMSAGRKSLQCALVSASSPVWSLAVRCQAASMLQAARVLVAMLIMSAPLCQAHGGISQDEDGVWDPFSLEDLLSAGLEAHLEAVAAISATAQREWCVSADLLQQAFMCTSLS